MSNFITRHTIIEVEARGAEGAPVVRNLEHHIDLEHNADLLSSHLENDRGELHLVCVWRDKPVWIFWGLLVATASLAVLALAWGFLRGH